MKTKLTLMTAIALTIQLTTVLAAKGGTKVRKSENNTTFSKIGLSNRSVENNLDLTKDEWNTYLKVNKSHTDEIDLIENEEGAIKNNYLFLGKKSPDLSIEEWKMYLNKK